MGRKYSFSQIKPLPCTEFAHVGWPGIMKCQISGKLAPLPTAPTIERDLKPTSPPEKSRSHQRGSSDNDVNKLILRENLQSQPARVMIALIAALEVQLRIQDWFTIIQIG